MNGFFRMDGPFYRFGNTLYYLIVANILWFIFSIPLFTVGASTTALFYVMGKVVRDEDVNTFKDFWKSFKLNFKQGTLIWILEVVFYAVVINNIRNISMLGNMGKYIYPFQIAIFIELTIISIYIYPLLSRYEMTFKNLVKTAFFIGNRHILSTVVILASIVAIYFLLTKVPALIVLMPMSLFALCSYYMINRIFQKYMPEKKEEEPEGEEE